LGKSAGGGFSPVLLCEKPEQQWKLDLNSSIFQSKETFL